MLNSKRLSLAVLLTVFLLKAEVSFAAPEFHEVVHGKAQVQQAEHQTTIHQSSDKAILNWKSFNIHSQESVHFQQPQGGITLNRIDPALGASFINGKLSATSKIILLNGAGIHFGPSAYVNVGSLIASGLDLSNENFLAGQYQFNQTAQYKGPLTNQGHIKAAKHGLVALIGPHINNEGMIEAKFGTIALGSGSHATLGFHGGDLIHFTVGEAVKAPDQAQNKRGVKNTGQLHADGGKILVHASAASAVLDKVINMKGIARATSVEKRGGKIILHGGSQGRVIVAGRLEVSGKSKAARGGKIKVLGQKIEVKTAELLANGESGGGQILLGTHSVRANTQGETRAVLVSLDSRLEADALNQGHGGDIIIRSQEETLAHGSFSVKGRGLGGGGGHLETASKGFLKIDGLQADLRGEYGETGTWSLLAPRITLRDNQKVKADGKWGKEFSNIDTQTIKLNLAKANVRVVNGPGLTPLLSPLDGDLTVSSNLSWHSQNTLTLSAYRNIDLMHSLIANDGKGNLVLVSDYDNRGIGSLHFLGTSPQIIMNSGGSIVLQHNVYRYGQASGSEDYSKKLSLSSDTYFMDQAANLAQAHDVALSDEEDDFSKRPLVRKTGQQAAVWLSDLSEGSWEQSSALQESKLEEASQQAFPVFSSLTSQDLQYLTESDFKRAENLHSLASSLSISEAAEVVNENPSLLNSISQNDNASSSQASFSSLSSLAAYYDRQALNTLPKNSLTESHQFLANSGVHLSQDLAFSLSSLDSLSDHYERQALTALADSHLTASNAFLANSGVHVSQELTSSTDFLDVTLAKAKKAPLMPISGIAAASLVSLHPIVPFASGSGVASVHAHELLPLVPLPVAKVAVSLHLAAPHVLSPKPTLWASSRELRILHLPFPHFSAKPFMAALGDSCLISWQPPQEDPECLDAISIKKISLTH